MHRRQFVRGAAALTASGFACRSKPHAPGAVVATLWFSYGGKNREVLLDLVNRFNEAQREVAIQATFQGDYFEALAKLRSAIAAGVAPTFSHVVAEVIPYLANAGVLEPLDSYEGSRAIDFVKALGQRGAFVERDGALVAIPFNRSTPIMYINGNFLRDTGLTVPQTWDELVNAAKRMQGLGREELRWGFEVPISWWFWFALMGQAGGSMLDAAGRVHFGGKAGEEAIRFLQRLIYEDKTMRAPPGRDYNAWQASNQNFISGRVGIIWNSTAFVRYLEDNAPFPVLAAPLPGNVRRSVPTGGTFFVILRGAPTLEKQAAWKFLRWMCAPEQTIEWATRTGYLPVTESATARLMESGYYAKHPNDRVAYEQLADVTPWPWLPSLFRLQRDILEPHLEDAVLNRKDAHAAIEHARAVALDE